MGFDIILHPNGTYQEAGGLGRWAVRENALHIQIVEPPTATFISMYPELMALDDDGRLPFVGAEEVEAVSGQFAKRFRRCR